MTISVYDFSPLLIKDPNQIFQNTEELFRKIFDKEYLISGTSRDEDGTQGAKHGGRRRRDVLVKIELPDSASRKISIQKVYSQLFTENNGAILIVFDLRDRRQFVDIQ